MRGLVKFAFAAGVGAVAAYLLDPVSGKGRRVRLEDQAAARAREAKEEVEARARYEAGRARGVIHDLTPDDPGAPIDDATLLQKVRSEAIGPSTADSGDIDELQPA